MEKVSFWKKSYLKEVFHPHYPNQFKYNRRSRVQHFTTELPPGVLRTTVEHMFRLPEHSLFPIYYPASKLLTLSFFDWWTHVSSMPLFVSFPYVMPSSDLSVNNVSVSHYEIRKYNRTIPTGWESNSVWTSLAKRWLLTSILDHTIKEAIRRAS